MHGWGISRGMSHSAQLTRSRLPIMHSYSSVASESPSLPPYARPLSTPRSRALPLQILLALFTTLVILSSVLQFSGMHHGLRYVDGDEGAPIAVPMALMATQELPSDPLDSDILHAILERLDSEAMSTAEDVSFSIAYNGKTVHNGDYVPMSEAATAPRIAIEDGAALFTWMLVDIDAPDPRDPSHAPFLHYIVADVSAAAAAVDANQQVVVPYYPVTPPKGEHRYVSLLFRQQAPHVSTPEEQEQDERLSAQRANFNVVAYAKDHALVLVRTQHFYSQPEHAGDEEADSA